MNKKEMPLFFPLNPNNLPCKEGGDMAIVFGKYDKELDYTCSHHLITLDEIKWETCVKQAEAKALKYSYNYYEAILSNYFDKPIIIKNILIGLKDNNIYQVFGYIEAIETTGQQSHVETLTDKTRHHLYQVFDYRKTIETTGQQSHVETHTGKTNSATNKLNNTDNSQVTEDNQVTEHYGLATLYKDCWPTLGRLVAINLIVVFVIQTSERGKLFAVLIGALGTYLMVNLFLSMAKTRLFYTDNSLYLNNKALALIVATALINIIPTTYLMLIFSDKLVATIFFILMVATQLTNNILPFYEDRKEFLELLEIRKMAISSYV